MSSTNADIDEIHNAGIIDLHGLDQLIGLLRDQYYTVIGPMVSDGIIVYDELNDISDLPNGVTDEQQAGSYRLIKSDDTARFGYNVGPHSIKEFLHPSRLLLWQAQRDNSGQCEIASAPAESPKFAFLGVRACELAAVAVQDRVLLESQFVDTDYAQRRAQALFIGVNCNQAGKTCFCVSMNTGPQVTQGHDLVLTEIIDSGVHRFLIESGSAAGHELMSALTTQPANNSDFNQQQLSIDHARKNMGRQMQTEGIKALLQENPEHPRWDEVASRCLSCANCTMVCPTCFCSTVEEANDLAHDKVERWRRSDSCFTMDFTYIHGGSVRSSPKSRYRQWLTHKLAHWHDQFDSSGCVGCGRCITWCPVGIDITQEVAAIQSSTDAKGADQ